MTEFASLSSVRVVNFQSIKDSTINFGRLSVLVGAGDVGKSAVLRAIRAAFLNEGHDDGIRHGASSCEVTLSFSDGAVIFWSKDKGKGGCYVFSSVGVSEQTFSKTGGAVPDEIAEYLGIGEIEVDAVTFDRGWYDFEGEKFRRGEFSAIIEKNPTLMEFVQVAPLLWQEDAIAIQEES